MDGGGGSTPDASLGGWTWQGRSGEGGRGPPGFAIAEIWRSQIGHGGGPSRQWSGWVVAWSTTSGDPPLPGSGWPGLSQPKDSFGVEGGLSVLHRSAACLGRGGC